MKRPIRILVSTAIVTLTAACAGVPPAPLSSVRHAEDRLGTGSDYLDFQYHVLSEDRHASSLKFEGYLLAFEKSRRELIGFESPWLSCSFFATEARREAIFNESGLDYKAELIEAYPEWVNFACKRLDDRARIFLSHAVKFQFEAAPIPHLAPSILFSVYPTNHQGAGQPPGLLTCDDLPSMTTPDGPRCSGGDRIYTAGWSYISQQFAKELAEKLSSGKFTHVIVASMGWNTNELETIQNYNSLIGNMLEAARLDEFKIGGKEFRPLFIGLAWPSAWTFRTGALASFFRGLSVINKGYDADELGMTWYGALINVALREAIEDKSVTRRPTVITIGHSYGARALSHAVAACPFFGNLKVADCRSEPTVDVTIGIEGAFNRSRFLSPKPDGSYPDGTFDIYIYRDGSPLQRYDALLSYGTRHFYIWSLYDGATTRFNLIGGGDHICKFTGGHSSRFSVMPCMSTVNKVYDHARPDGVHADEEAIAMDACKTAAAYLEPGCPILGTGEQPTSDGFVTTSDRVLLIDGSGFIHNETPLHGGGAHSDIYKWEVGTVIWRIIRDNSRMQ